MKLTIIHRCFITLFITILSIALSSAPVSAASRPTDIDNHWAYPIIMDYYQSGKISGFPDGTFKPDNSVTRAQFVQMLTVILPVEIIATDKSFIQDIKPTDWYYPCVSTFESLGYITPKPDGEFAPNEPITREYAAEILVNALPLITNEKNKTMKFSDSNQVSSEMNEAFNTLISRGILNGYPDGTIRPKGAITRAEAITLISKALNSNGKTDLISNDSVSAHQAFESEILRLVNVERAKVGLAPLKPFTILDEAADIRAEEAAALFSHTRTDGSSFFTIFSDYSLKYSAAGENLGYGYPTPSDLVSAWMQSDGHRKNILNGKYIYLGVGYYEKENGDIYCSQIFYTPPKS